MTIEADNQMMLEELEIKSIALMECDNKLMKQDREIAALKAYAEELLGRIEDMLAEITELKRL